MALSQPYASATLTVSTTELSLISGNSTLQSSTTAGIYQVFLDLSALAAQDAFRLRIKEVVVSGGTQRVILDETFAPNGGAFATPNYASPALQLMNGWDVTVIKNDGTDRIIPYSIRQVA